MSQIIRPSAWSEKAEQARRQVLDYTSQDRDQRLVLFLLLHIGLGFLFQVDPIFPTFHAWMTLILGLIYLRELQPTKVIYVAAYITSTEILWRGTGANIFWEFGKLSLSLLFALGVLKHYRGQLPKKWPLVYFVLLLPSILLLPTFDRQAISFNLSGPLALAVAVIFFGRIRFYPEQIKNTLVALIAPTISLATISLYSALTTGLITFDLAYSEKLTSAGIGPNQVSSILGLGAFAAFLFTLMETHSRQIRWIMIGLTIWFLGQSALTFSRGGFWTALGAMIVVGMYFFREPRNRALFLTSISSILLVGYFVVFPALDRLTSNTLVSRFSSFDLTGRGEIIKADWLTFLANPLFGVGPDQSEAFHAITFRASRAHTEYSRMLSEHGMFGAAALLILLGAAGYRVFRKGTFQQKALVISFTLWGLLFMFHAATRLVAPSFMFGIAAARFITVDTNSHSHRK